MLGRNLLPLSSGKSSLLYGKLNHQICPKHWELYTRPHEVTLQKTLLLIQVHSYSYIISRNCFMGWRQLLDEWEIVKYKMNLYHFIFWVTTPLIITDRCQGCGTAAITVFSIVYNMQAVWHPGLMSVPTWHQKTEDHKINLHNTGNVHIK